MPEGRTAPLAGRSRLRTSAVKTTCTSASVSGGSASESELPTICVSRASFTNCDVCARVRRGGWAGRGWAWSESAGARSGRVGLRRVVVGGRPHRSRSRSEPGARTHPDMLRVERVAVQRVEREDVPDLLHAAHTHARWRRGEGAREVGGRARAQNAGAAASPVGLGRSSRGLGSVARGRAPGAPTREVVRRPRRRCAEGARVPHLLDGRHGASGATGAARNDGRAPTRGRGDGGAGACGNTALWSRGVCVGCGHLTRGEPHDAATAHSCHCAAQRPRGRWRLPASVSVRPP